jgi:hypothetical protein
MNKVLKCSRQAKDCNALLPQIWTTTKGPFQARGVITNTNREDVRAEINKSLSNFRKYGLFDKSPYYFNEYHVVKGVYTETGQIVSIPKWYRFGMLKIILNIILFIAIGMSLSHRAVKILDENDIFKPESEDDDEDDD